MDNFLRIGLLLCVVGTAFAAAYLGFFDKTEAAGILAALCFGLCIFLFLSRFKQFKGLGFEAELWEQEMERAAEIRGTLNDLTIQLAEKVYWDLGEGARMGKRDAGKILKSIQTADQSLEAVGLDGATINEKKRPWHKVVIRDLAQPICNRVLEFTKQKRKSIEVEILELGALVTADNEHQHASLAKNSAALAQASQQLQNLVWRDDYENVPNLLRQYINEALWLTDADRRVVYTECADAFLDIEQYAAERTIRRPEVLDL